MKSRRAKGKYIRETHSRELLKRHCAYRPKGLAYSHTTTTQRKSAKCRRLHIFMNSAIPIPNAQYTVAPNDRRISSSLSRRSIRQAFPVNKINNTYAYIYVYIKQGIYVFGGDT